MLTEVDVAGGVDRAALVVDGAFEVEVAAADEDAAVDVAAAADEDAAVDLAAAEEEAAVVVAAAELPEATGAALPIGTSVWTIETAPL